MGILFEARSIYPNKSGGIENYLYMLVKAWNKYYPNDIIMLNVPIGTKLDYEAKLENVEILIDKKYEKIISLYKRNYLFRKALSFLIRVFPNLEPNLFGLRKSWVKFLDSRSDVIIYPFQREKFVHIANRTIFIMHDFREWDLKNGERRIINEQIIAIKNSAAVVVSWPYPYKRLIQLFPDLSYKTYEIPFLYDEYDSKVTNNGFAKPEFLYFPSANAIHKNHENLILGLKLHNDRYPNLKLKLICTGPIDPIRKKVIDKLVFKTNMNYMVEFLGFVDRTEVFKLYQNCYSVVTSSKYEAFSGAILEAIRFKKPVIASAIQPNVLFCEKYNLKLNLFDPDNPESIAKCIHDLIVNYPIHINYSTSGFQRLMNINSKNTVDQFREIAFKIKSSNEF